MISLLLKLSTLVALASADHFLQGNEYSYTFTGTAMGDFMKLSDSKSGFKYTCELSVYIPAKDEGILNVKSCELFEFTKDGQVSSVGSSVFNRRLTQYPVRFHTKKGFVKPDGLTVNTEESIDVLNLKRSMISAFQWYKPSPELYEGKKTITDVYGECQTTFSEGPNSEIFSERDLAACRQPRITFYHYSLHSNIQQLRGGIEHIDFAELSYDFETTEKCEKHLDNGRLKLVKCIQDHKVIPFSNRAEDNTIISMGTVSQYELTFLDMKATSFSYEFGSTRKAGIEFEFEDEIVKDTNSMAIFLALEKLADASDGEDMVKLARAFDKTVQYARSANENEIRGTNERIDRCRCNKERKALLQSLYGNVLKSCGSQECIAELLNGMVDKQIGGRGLSNFLTDMMMNHDANPTALRHTLTMCKNLRTQQCLMLLSGMVRNYARKQSVTDIQDQNGVVFEVFAFIREVLGDKCIPNPTMPNRVVPSTPKEQQDEIRTAIKSVGNLGNIIQIYDQVADLPIVPTILNCIDNSEVSENLRKSAILSLQKMNVDDNIRGALMGIVKDDLKLMAYRSSAFVVLVREERKETVKQLHDLMYAEKSTNMKNFMITFIGNLMESQEKANFLIQDLWREVLKESSKEIPQLDPLMFGKSRYTEMSRQFVLPLTQKNFGIQITLTVVYEPGNLVARSIVVNASVTWKDEVYNILEVGGDFIGLETFVDAVVDKEGLFGKTFKDKLNFFGGMVKHDEESVRKMAKEAKETIEQLEQAKNLGIFANVGTDPRILAELPITFDPSIIPDNIDITKYLKNGIKHGGLPSDINKDRLAAVIAEVEAEKASTGSSFLPPGVEEIMKLVLKKPEYEYVKHNYRELHKKMFSDVNYPRMSFPSGQFYIKTMGNELRYITTEDLLGYLKHFTSSEDIKEYFDFAKVLAEFTVGKKIAWVAMKELSHKHIVMPSIIGVPINMTMRATRVNVFNTNIKITPDLQAEHPLFDIGGSINGKYTILLQGDVKLQIPTRAQSIGLGSETEVAFDLDVKGSIKYEAQSLAALGKPKSITITRDNHQQPKEIFALRNRFWLEHWVSTEAIKGPEQYRVERRKCTPDGLEQLTGRRACWIESYIDASSLPNHPFWPQSGEYSGSYQILPLDNGVKTYSVVMEFGTKPCPVMPKHTLRTIEIKYEGKDAAGSSLSRNAEAHITFDPKRRTFDVHALFPMYNNSELFMKYEHMRPSAEHNHEKDHHKHSGAKDAHHESMSIHHHKRDHHAHQGQGHHNGQGHHHGQGYRQGQGSSHSKHERKEYSSQSSSMGPSSMKKTITAEVHVDGQKMYGLHYYRKQDVRMEEMVHPFTRAKVKVPLRTMTLFGNYSMPRMSMQALITMEQSLTGKRTSELEAFYFCDMVDSPLYDLHMNPEDAKLNGHVTKMTNTNELKLKLIGADWKLDSTHTLKYPGQDMVMTNTIEAKHQFGLINRSTIIEYDDEKDGRQVININSEITRNSLTRSGFDYSYNTDFHHIDAYKIIVDGKITGSLKNSKLSDLKITGDVDYTKHQSRRKRSLANSFARGLLYLERSIGYGFVKKTPPADESNVVDWNKWKANLIFEFENGFLDYQSTHAGTMSSTLYVKYPREDRYQTIEADLNYAGERYSYRETHGHHNVTIGFTSSYLESSADIAVGWDGQWFGEEGLFARAYIHTTDLTSGDVWPILDSRYKRIRRNFIDATHKFHTQRTDYFIRFLYENVKDGKKWKLIESLTSEIAPVLNHKLIFTGDCGETRTEDYLLLNCGFFDYNRNVTISYPTSSDISVDAIAVLSCKYPTKETYDMTLGARFKPGKDVSANYEATERETGTKYFVDAEMLTPKQIKVTTHRQNPGKEKRAGLTWILNKINSFQIENKLSWGKEFGDIMYDVLVKAVNGFGRRYSNMAIMYLSNINKPFWKKVIPYSSGKTVEEVYDSHVQPRLDDLVRKLDDYKVWGRSVGSTIKGYVVKVRAVRRHSMKSLKESIVGRTLTRLSPGRPVRKLLGDTIPKMIAHWQKHPPAMIFNYWNRRYYPVIEKIFEDRQNTMVISHIFLQDSFVELPRLHRWAGSFFAWVKHIKEKLRGHEEGNPPYIAMTFPEHVYTFNGRIFHVPTTGRQCTYVLGSDMKDAEFSIVKEGDWVTFFSKDATFCIGKNNEVKIDDATIKLPLKTDKVTIMKRGPMLVAEVPKHGVHIHCDSYNSICQYEMHGHRNHSLGLLGRNDNDYITDFYTPAGMWTDNTHKFLNAFDVSGSCDLDQSTYKPRHENVCMNPHDICVYAFLKTQSIFAPCFLTVPKEEFYKACNTETSQCGLTNQKEVACRITAAYRAICIAKGVDVEPFPTCVECPSGKNMKSPSWEENVHSVVDHVIAVSTSKRMGANNYISQYVDKLASGSAGARFALTGFCGKGSKIYNSAQPFGSKEDVKESIRGLKPAKHLPPAGSELKAVMHAMRGLNFRPKSHRIVHLFTDTPSEGPIRITGEADQLASLLRDNSATFNVFSNYKTMNHDNVAAVNKDGAIPLGSASDIQDSRLPLDEIGDHVKKTNGYLFHRVKIHSVNYMDKAVSLVKKQLKVPAAHKRMCWCDSTHVGAPHVSCKYVRND